VENLEISPRQLVILKTLNDHNAPMRACQLHRKCSENALYGKENGGGFWREDFTDFIKKMTARELVQRIELPANRVFYAMSKKGNRAYLKQYEPDKARILQNTRFDRAFKRVLRYSDEDCLLELIAAAAEVSVEVISREILLRLGRALGRIEFEISKYPTNHGYQDDTKKKLIAVYGALKQFLSLEQEALISRQLLKKIDEVFKEEHEREVQYRATIVRKSLGNCMFCGAQIHNEDAAKDAELLKKYAGTKTGLICCGCFNHLQWVDKFLVMGGETVCKEQC